MIKTRVLDQEFKRLRRQMVEEQLRTRGIKDKRVLAAMSKGEHPTYAVSRNA